MDFISLFLVLVYSLRMRTAAVLPPAVDITLLESGEPECEAALGALRQGLDTGQLWAEAMVEAGVRSPVGLLSHTSVQFGDFDECLTLHSPVSPMFCLVEVTPTRPNNASWSKFLWGLCVPEVCSALGLRASLQTHMNNESHGEGVSVAIYPAACTTPTTASISFDFVDIAFCVVMLCIVLLVTGATIHEVLLDPDYDGVSPPKTLAQCLSARRSLCSLVRREKPLAGIDLSALYGLHFFAFCLVLIGHRVGFSLVFTKITNYRDVHWAFTNHWASMWTAHGDLFVDIFFFTSAFLLGMLYYSKLDSCFVNPIAVYFNRLVRILPAYAVSVLLACTLLQHLGDGPLWNLFVAPERERCREYWWTNLLFISNYYMETMCMGTSWYIACDFQLFVVGTLLVFVLHKSPTTGALVSALVFFASVFTLFLGTYILDRPAFMMMYDMSFWNDPRHHKTFSTVYSQGHFRGTSYIVGLLTGVYVFRRRRQQLSACRTYIYQLLGFTLSLGIYWSGAFFTDLSNPPSRLVSALYAPTHHVVFGLGLAFLFISLTQGRQTFILRIFSWQGFVPLSKLSFCAYLLSFFPLAVWVGSTRTPAYWNLLEMVSGCVADICISQVLALALYLAVESPTCYLVKRFTSGSETESCLPKSTNQGKEVF